MWKNVLKCRDDLQKFIVGEIANGRNTNLWRDPWLNGQTLIAKLGWDTLASLGSYDSKVILSFKIEIGSWKDESLVGA